MTRTAIVTGGAGGMGAAATGLSSSFMVWPPDLVLAGFRCRSCDVTWTVTPALDGNLCLHPATAPSPPRCVSRRENVQSCQCGINAGCPWGGQNRCC